MSAMFPWAISQIQINETIVSINPPASFYTRWKYLEISGFLMFSAGIDRDQWQKIDKLIYSLSAGQ